MKKTLIALMAFAGVACAAEPITFNKDAFNWSVDYMLSSLDYQYGDAFALSFSIDTISYGHKSLVQLDDHYYMSTAQSGQAGYVGLSYTDASVKDASGNDANPNYTAPSVSDTVTKTFTWNSEGYLYSWISANDTGSAHTPWALQGATITIASDGTDSSITLIKQDGPTCIVNLSGVALDATKVNLYEHITGASGTISVAGSEATAIIPEPATATLSLLALAGLAARRRRK